MKKCVKCNVLKDYSCFGNLKSSKDGLRSHCRDCRKIESKDFRIKNKDYLKNYLSLYYKNNKESLSQYHKKWLYENKEKYREARAGYYKTDRYKKYNSIYKKTKRDSDALYKLKGNVRCRIKNFLLKSKFGTIGETEKLIGCSFDILKSYLEIQFKDGMNWGNYGMWHIDHIKPLSLAKTEQDVFDLCNYKNLQPLWAKDNLIKGKIY